LVVEGQAGLFDYFAGEFFPVEIDEIIKAFYPVLSKNFEPGRLIAQVMSSVAGKPVASASSAAMAVEFRSASSSITAPTNPKQSKRTLI
jgi:hypothetical protein